MTHVKVRGRGAVVQFLGKHYGFMTKIRTTTPGGDAGCPSGPYRLQALDIHLPRTLTKVNDNAFEGCISLNSLELTDISIIGNNAFKGCVGVTKVTFSQMLTSVGKDAFKGFKFYEKDGKATKMTAENLVGKSFSGPYNVMMLI